MTRGTIRKHPRADGVRYEVVVDLGLHPTTGKRQQRSKTFTTKKEAQKYLTAWLTAIDGGTAVDHSPETVAQAFAYWLETQVKPRLRAKTAYDYEQTITKHILPALGAVPLQKLTAAQVQAFYGALQVAGVGVRTIRLCHLHLHQVLAQALKLGTVTRDVTTMVTQPQEHPKEMRVWEDIAHVHAFLAVAGQSTYGPIWSLALATGLRRGELLGLRWKDLDLEGQVLRVRQTVGALRGAPEFKPPKTRSSRRDVPLPAVMVGLLREHRRRQNEERLRLGEYWHDHDLVFAAANGNPINPDNVSRDFVRLVERAGVPWIRVHDLRHTHVTHALGAGANLKALSESIGHADVGITLRTYTHVMPTQRLEVAEKVGAAFFTTPTEGLETGQTG